MNFTLIIVGLTIAYFLFEESGGIMSLGSSLIDRMADAIQAFEGWQPGVSLSWKNNNPGNIKYFGGEKWQGQEGVDSRGFVIFNSYNAGRRALIVSLTNAATGKSGVYSPSDTLEDFFKKYAPSNDNNDPIKYARFVANRLGVPVNSQIGTLV